MVEEFISEFYSVDRKRKAHVTKDKYHYAVHMYVEHSGLMKLYNTELISNHTLQYAEDLAENFVLGVGPFKDLV